jgi:hypothetical protein
MFDLCMDVCARELGFGWGPEDRARLLRLRPPVRAARSSGASEAASGVGAS